MKKYTTILLSLLCAVVYAQDVEFKKGKFKDDKDGFKAALSQIELGDELLEQGKA